MSATHLALLRAINVGGKNKLPMTELRDIFLGAGCRDVQTYIQSGNVLFTADPDIVAPLAGVITARIAERFGYRVPIVLRTASQMADATCHNPFIARGESEERLYVAFLAQQPAAQRVESLDPDRSPPDEFVVRGADIYLHLPLRVGQTRLTNDYFDTKLATTSTVRNWRTVTTLHALMNG